MRTSPRSTLLFRAAATVAMTLLATLAAAPRPALGSVGGQDALIASLALGDGAVHYPRLVIASGGTEFAVFKYYNAVATQAELRVYRSTSGGKTWATWGTPQVIHGWLDAAIIPGTPEQLMVVWGDEGAIVTETLWTMVADATQATPVWTSMPITTVTWPNYFLSPHIATMLPGGGPPAEVALSWVETDYASTANTRVRYAHSTDGGGTFASPITLVSVTPGWAVYDDVTMFPATGTVGAVWLAVNPTTQVGNLRYRGAVNGGDVLADWSPAVTVRQVTQTGTTTQVSVAADPNGSGGVIACAEDHSPPTSPSALVFLSTDSGSTWPITKTFADLAWPESFWGALGPAVAGRVVPWGSVGTGALELARPTGLPQNSWVAEEMMHGDGTTPWGAALAQDPTHGNELAMVAMMPNLADSGASPWFDAEWRANGGLGVPKFEPGIDVGGEISSAPAISDLDDDGNLEVVFTTKSPGRLLRFDLETQTTTTLANVAQTSAASAPAVIDVDNDGRNEVFCGNTTGRVYGVHEDGTAVSGYPIDTGTGSDAWVTCGQVTASGTGEVIAASGVSIWLYGPQGQLRDGFPAVGQPARGNLVGRVALGDLDGDRWPEMVAAYEHGVVILDRFGNRERTLLTSGPALSGGVSLADLDGDGRLEIAVPRANGSVALIHDDGTTFGSAWPWSSGTGQPIGSIAITDFFGGSGRDLVFASVSGDVFAVDLSGATPGGWSFPIGAHLEGPAEPIVSNFSPLGGVQIALGDVSDYAYVQKPNGAQNGWPRSFYGVVEHACAAGDLDGDGIEELVIPAGSRLWVMDMGATEGPLLARWPMAGARATRTGCRDCETYWSTAAPNVAPAASASVMLHAGEPNPFHAQTTLRYELPHAAANLDLKVYDVTGRLVRTLVQGPQAEGSHVSLWDGRDDARRNVASGVYLVRLAAGGVTQTQRVVRLQ